MRHDKPFRTASKPVNAKNAGRGRLGPLALPRGNERRRTEAAALDYPPSPDYAFGMAEKNQTGPRRIAYLKMDSYDEYNDLVIGGLTEAMTAVGAELIIFSAQILFMGGDPASGIQGLYSFIKAAKPDGLIVYAWMPCVLPPDTAAFVDAFPELPIFFLGEGYLGRPFAHLKGYDYLRSMVEHMAVRHGRSRIAFVSTMLPDDRDAAYIDYMKETGLWDERYYLSGTPIRANSTGDRIAMLLSRLFDDPAQPPPDTIIALSTNEAVSMLSELKRRRIAVPGDVAVITWENGEGGRSSDPPLTCVDYPFYDLGRVGGERFLEILDGKRVPQETLVPTRILFRESCGCGLAETAREKFRPKADEPAMRRFLPPEADRDRLYARLEADAADGGDAFTKTWERLVKADADEATDLSLRRILTGLRRRHFAAAAGTAGSGLFDRLEAAQAMIDEVGRLDLARSAVRTIKAEQVLDYTSLALIAAQDRGAALGSAAAAAAELSVPSCWIFLATEADAESGGQCLLTDRPHTLADRYRFEVGLWFQAGCRRPEMEKRFGAFSALLEDALTAKTAGSTILGKLLHFNDRFQGFMLFERGELDTRILESFSRFVCSALNGVRILDDLYAARNRMQELAERDSLTGLGNRYAFYRDLRLVSGSSTAAATSIAADTPSFALMFLDLDAFKAINDIFSHDAGDFVLKETADRIVLAIAEKAIGIYRIGGDEFTIILHSSGPAAARALTDRLFAELKRPYRYLGRNITVGASIGIAHFPRDSTDPDELVKFADLSMYRAKRSKDSAVVFDKRQAARFLARAELAGDLQQAAEKDQIEVLYQGIYESGGALSGVEALARWRHPRRGLLAPADFLDLAVAGNAIAAIETRVFGLACGAARELRASPSGPQPFLLVNCAKRFFWSPGFVEIVKTAIAAAGLEKGSFRLGLEERFADIDPDSALAIIKDLETAGAGFAVDGLCGNPSWLQFLRRLPPDTIVKINRSFVENIVESATDRAILERLLSLLEACGLKPAVSGVENAAQLDFLRRQHCLMQGFALSTPTSFQELVR